MQLHHIDNLLTAEGTDHELAMVTVEFRQLMYDMMFKNLTYKLFRAFKSIITFLSILETLQMN